MTNHKILFISWLLLLYQVQSNTARESDSLQSALKAVTQRQRDLSDLTDLYYLGPDGNYHRFGEEIAVYLPQREVEGDGQPEDIGYGYQKTIAPKAAGIFEPIPLPQSELGIHDASEGRSQRFEKLLLNYLDENNEQLEHDENQDIFRSRLPDVKRSIFRERGDSHLPDALQSLYLDETESMPLYNVDDDQPKKNPSLFRERFKGNFQPLKVHNMPALVRNFGDLDKNPDRQHDNNNDPDEYINVLNSVWEKYKDSNLDTVVDPEDISESDAAELMDYMDERENKKRQYESPYESGFDFFNSPLQWTKRSKPKLSKSDFHTLKLIEDGEPNRGVSELLINKPYFNRNEKNIHKEKLWQDNAFDERYPFKSMSKRYPVAKRSPSLYYKSSSNVLQREKKNVNNENSSSKTDPKVAQELSDIFSVSTVEDNNQNNLNRKTSNLSISNVHFNSQNKPDSKLEVNTNNSNASDFNNNHIHLKKTGQKEETISNPIHKPLEITKKSVNWSDYFGIDRRKKSTSNQDVTSKWLLDQYLKAYSLSSNALKDSTDAFNNVYQNMNDNQYIVQKKGQDDMDAKLRAMEDLIVDQALKYTGAHEGMTDSKEVQEVKDRVISQLAAAYSLEKMRRALSEFKSSIAAQKASAPTTITPNVTPEHSEKRIAVKKEKTDIVKKEKNHEKKEDMENNIKYSDQLKTPKSYPRWSSNIFVPDQIQKSWKCPILQDMYLKCKSLTYVLDDVNHIFLPLCSLHQLCYACGSQLIDFARAKCDATFITEAQNICQDNASCRYTAHQILHSLKSESMGECNGENQSCIAYFLSEAMR